MFEKPFADNPKKVQPFVIRDEQMVIDDTQLLPKTNTRVRKCLTKETLLRRKLDGCIKAIDTLTEEKAKIEKEQINE